MEGKSYNVFFFLMKNFTMLSLYKLYSSNICVNIWGNVAKHQAINGG